MGESKRILTIWWLPGKWQSWPFYSPYSSFQVSHRAALKNRPEMGICIVATFCILLSAKPWFIFIIVQLFLELLESSFSWKWVRIFHFPLEMSFWEPSSSCSHRDRLLQAFCTATGPNLLSPSSRGCFSLSVLGQCHLFLDLLLKL